MTGAVRSGPRCRWRGDFGLATLEWLLIVAAVAGIAVLGVVLVQGQVEDTAQGLADPDPRATAAAHSAFTVEADAKAATTAEFQYWADWEDRFRERCGLIGVLYADAGVQVVANNFDGDGTTFDAAAAAAADAAAATGTKAQVQCEVR